MPTRGAPAEWSVDAVVKFLCNPEYPRWLPALFPSISPRPRPDPRKLEAALRSNQVCGKTLLDFDHDSFKLLGIEDISERLSLMRAIYWLKDLSYDSLENNATDRAPDLRETDKSEEYPDKLPGTLPTTTTGTLTKPPFGRSMSRDSMDAWCEHLLKKYPPGPLLESPQKLTETNAPSAQGGSIPDERSLTRSRRNRDDFIYAYIVSQHSWYQEDQSDITGEDPIQAFIVETRNAWYEKCRSGYKNKWNGTLSEIREVASEYPDGEIGYLETEIKQIYHNKELLMSLKSACTPDMVPNKECENLVPVIHALTCKRWIVRMLTEHTLSYSNYPCAEKDRSTTMSDQSDSPSSDEDSHEGNSHEDENGDSDADSTRTPPGEESETDESNEYESDEDTDSELPAKRPRLNSQPITDSSSSVTDFEPMLKMVQDKSFDLIEAENNKSEMVAKLVIGIGKADVLAVDAILKDFSDTDLRIQIRVCLKMMCWNDPRVKESWFYNWGRIITVYLSWISCHLPDKRRGVPRNLAVQGLDKLGSTDSETSEFWEFLDLFDPLIRAWAKIVSEPTLIASDSTQAPICLNAEIAESAKPHQVEGVRFLWRQTCEVEGPQGCLLADIMGLGKTMQAIAFLATVAEASKSRNPEIRAQVPEILQKAPTLILCPAGLIQNWSEEFRRWLPKLVPTGPILTFPANVKRDKKEEMIMEKLKAWKKHKGILILSYESFRNFVIDPKDVRSKNPRHWTRTETISNALLNEPGIVIADEAHKISSTTQIKSQLACSVQWIKSKYRIALTGTPLSNNLKDWFHIMDWISPGYLGTFEEFKRKFIDPIQAGLEFGCGSAPRRQGRRVQKLLTKILAPKYLRRDWSSVGTSLPPKTEFTISVSLTAAQKEVYNTFVEALNSSGLSKSFLRWSHLVQLCCNHPLLFLNSYAERKQNGLEESNAQGDKDILNGMIMDLSLKFLAMSPDTLSHRMMILRLILDACRQAGDKVLVFTHSIQTLRHIEYTLKSAGRTLLRIDGTTSSQHRQLFAHQFNRNQDIEVMLISTEAGGVGLNLFGANRVIIFDTDFNPSWENQAVGRAYRMRQEKPVFVYRLMASGTFEELLYSQAVVKTELSYAVVDQQELHGRGQQEKTEWLFPVKERERKPFEDMVDHDPEVMGSLWARDTTSAIVSVDLHRFEEAGDDLTEEEVAWVEDEYQKDQQARRIRSQFPATNGRRFLF